MNEIKNRGVNDVFIAVVDGLKGFVNIASTMQHMATILILKNGCLFSKQ